MKATNQPRQKLLDHLAQVAQGGVAELMHPQSNEVFFRYHMPVPDHERILDPSVLLILGGRGAGKSQLFQALRRLPDRSKLAISNRTPAARVTAVEHVDYAVGFEKRGTTFPTAEDLSSALDMEIPNAPRLVWIGLLSGALLTSPAYSGLLTAFLPDELVRTLREKMAYPQQWLGEAARHIDVINRALDNLEKSLDARGAALVITYDDLDVLAVKLIQVFPFVRELLAFWSDRSRRWNRLRCKIFLRTDIFNAEALAFADSSKLIPRSLTLSWSQDNLYRLLIKRLINGPQEKTWRGYLDDCVPPNAFKKAEPWGLIPQTNSEHHQRLVAKLIGRYMGTDPKRGESYRWFFNHLQDSRGNIAPRSFLKLFENAAARQSREGLNKLSDEGLLSPSQIQGALQEVSKDRIDELAEEYPWIGALKKSLVDSVVPMSRNEFADVLSKTKWEIGAAPRDTKPDQLVNEMLSLGILRETADKRIHVPDIYLYGFGLKRKGGIKRPEI